MDKVRVLIADDSAFMRKTLTTILAADPGLAVVGTARNGQEAVDQARALQPDVVTLDINMPVMDGVTALQLIMLQCPCPVVMLSSLTQEGALTTLECLELGAVDFVGKPSGTISLDIAKQSAEIVEKVALAARSRRPGGPVRRPAPRPRRVETTAAPVVTPGTPAAVLVAIGVSTGGPKTIMDILPRLPADLPAAVAVVQHMPETFTGSFAKRLNEHCALAVKEAEAGDRLLTGHAYVARGGKHLIFRRMSDGTVMARYHSQPDDALHIPSVDVMMDAAVEAFGARVVGVLLTGMGADGALAMTHIRAAGGRTIAESEETAIVFGMPGRAIELGGAEFVMPAGDVAEKIVELATTVARDARAAKSGGERA